KRVLAESQRLFEITDAADFAARLPAVHRALYLLFNEGYHGASPESAVRGELCREAQRLTGLLLEHPVAATPATYALAALMCLHASARRVEDTNWAQIVTLYDTLLVLRPSPVVALNRAIAVAQRDGPARGLEEIAAIADRERLDAYPFYHAALGELELHGRTDR